MQLGMGEKGCVSETYSESNCVCQKVIVFVCTQLDSKKILLIYERIHWKHLQFYYIYYFKFNFLKQTLLNLKVNKYGAFKPEVFFLIANEIEPKNIFNFICEIPDGVIAPTSLGVNRDLPAGKALVFLSIGQWSRRYPLNESRTLKPLKIATKTV